MQISRHGYMNHNHDIMRHHISDTDACINVMKIHEEHTANKLTPRCLQDYPNLMAAYQMRARAADPLKWRHRIIPSSMECQPSYDTCQLGAYTKGIRDTCNKILSILQQSPIIFWNLAKSERKWRHNDLTSHAISLLHPDIHSDLMEFYCQLALAQAEWRVQVGAHHRGTLKTTIMNFNQQFHAQETLRFQ